MRPIDETLKNRFTQAITAAFGAAFDCDPLIKSGDPKFADYQANVAMSLSKRLGRPPRSVAEEILKHLDLSPLCETPTIAGPGFINLRLRRDWIAQSLQQELALSLADSSRCGVDPVSAPQTIVVDYSGPNIAKQMHVGHLRSTIIGDTIARVLAFQGHRVIRQNHLGDFGTQFGMLIRYAQEKAWGEQVQIQDLDQYYKEASARDKADPVFAQEARQAVVALQSGESKAVALWEWIKAESRRHYTEIYRMLDITLSDKDERGESAFRDRLAPLVEKLKESLPSSDLPTVTPAAISSDTVPAASDNAAVIEVPPLQRAFVSLSEGALCVFLPGFVDREKKPQPLIVQKSDGASLYATTDLAAAYFRIQEPKQTPADQAPLEVSWHADRLIYTTDTRQSLHFSMIFATLRAARWDIHPVSGQTVSLEHAPFGTKIGEDGKPFKTRSGESVKLKDLLEEAVARAERVVAEKNPELAPEIQKRVARAVGIGAAKYADLRQDRLTDYIFSWDRMLALEGNTGPYLQYAYARIQSIFRKAGITGLTAPATLLLEEPTEVALGKKLLQFASVIESVGRDLKPHYLCLYLYELTSAFSAFYENCPVLKASEEIRASRLGLCHLTGMTLRVGLSDLLGIQTVEEM